MPKIWYLVVLANIKVRFANLLVPSMPYLNLRARERLIGYVDKVAHLNITINSASGVVKDFRLVAAQLSQTKLTDRLHLEEIHGVGLQVFYFHLVLRL